MMKNSFLQLFCSRQRDSFKEKSGSFSIEKCSTKPRFSSLVRRLVKHFRLNLPLTFQPFLINIFEILMANIMFQAQLFSMRKNYFELKCYPITQRLLCVTYESS